MSVESPTYEIAAGGALRGVERAIHLTRGGRRDWVRRCVTLIAIVYVPILVLGIADRLVSGEWPEMLVAVSTHVRALVAIPLLIAAEPLVDARARSLGTYMVSSGIVQDVDEYRTVVTRSVRRRDSIAAESVVLILAVASTLVDSPYFGAHRFAEWGMLPAAVVFRFLLLRWVWRWLLWFRFLWGLSRLPLALRATHPDRLAGLGPVLEPAFAFCVVIVACGATLAAAWADITALEGLRPDAFIYPAVTFTVIVLIVVTLPGVVFTGAMYKAREASLVRYGALSQRYAAAFDARWGDARGEDALGAADISGLCDLGGSYTVVPESRIVLWSPRLLQVATAAALLPMLPLAFYELGVSSIVERLGKVLL